MQNTNNAKILVAAGESSTLDTLEEIIRACENATQKLMSLLKVRKEEAKNRQLKQERAEQQKALAEAQQKQEEQESIAKEQAIEETRQKEKQAQLDAMLEENINFLVASFISSPFISFFCS